MPLWGARYRLTHTVAEPEEEVEVYQFLLDTLEIAEGEAKARYVPPVVSSFTSLAVPAIRRIIPAVHGRSKRLSSRQCRGLADIVDLVCR